MAPTVQSPSNNVSRSQPTYNQNQILAEQPKIQHQEEPNQHVDIKENQEPVKKDIIPNTEGILFFS